MINYNEFIEKTKTCKTPEEIQILAESNGITLTDEQCKEIAGGMPENVNPGLSKWW